MAGLILLEQNFRKKKNEYRLGLTLKSCIFARKTLIKCQKFLKLQIFLNFSTPQDQSSVTTIHMEILYEE